MTAAPSPGTGAEPNIRHTQLAPDLIQFEWNLLEYVTNVSDVMDIAFRGDIRVDSYEVFADSETSVTVYETNYLYRVIDDDDVVIFTVDVVYSEPSIENYLVTDSTVIVDIEGE